MENQYTIFNELKEISPAVANLNKHNLYSLPVGYFEGLSSEILASIFIQSLLNDSKDTVYTTPNGYFTHLADNILQKIKLETILIANVEDELENVAPLLNSISKQSPYSVPHGYFADFKMQAPTVHKTKIVVFGKWRKLVSYAAAAVFAGILAIGAIKYIKASYSLNIENEFAKTSESDIKNYLDNQPSVGYAFVSSATDDQEGSGFFEETSEDELQQFLKEQPEKVEIANKDI